MHLSHSSQVSEIVAVIWEIASKYFLRTIGNERAMDQLCVKREERTWRYIIGWRGMKGDSWFFSHKRSIRAEKRDPRRNRLLFSKLFYFVLKNQEETLSRVLKKEIPNQMLMFANEWKLALRHYRSQTRDKQLFQDPVNGLIDTAHSAGLDK